jgi:peroxiredoxin Q/BCP
VPGSPPAASRLARAGESVSDGDEAPSFDLLDHDSQIFSSAALQGTPYVLYFYPKDDTPGCTKEACDFRDSLARFAGSGLRVIGVSPDAPGTHSRFRDKYGLPFPLLSDPDKQLANAYGVWVKKNNYGREYMGIQRSTFLVDRAGVVRKSWRGVQVPGHIDAVLREAEQLK